MRINSKIHGIIDYVVVLFLWAAPSLFNLPEVTSTFTYVLGGVHLALTVLTRFELGLFKVIPFRIRAYKTGQVEQVAAKRRHQRDQISVRTRPGLRPAKDRLTTPS